jgi:hypothetical protein
VQEIVKLNFPRYQQHAKNTYPKPLDTPLNSNRKDCSMTESRSLRLVENVIDPPESGGAVLAFLRPNDHHPTHNPIAMSHLRLCLHNSQNSALVRPSSVGKLLAFPHNPHPADDADPSSLRHQRPAPAFNPITVRHLSLCPKKNQKTGLLRHASPLAFAPSSNRVTSHELRATTCYHISYNGDSNLIWRGLPGAKPP